ncbi:MAG: hypothetical protein V5A49_10330 [Haloarcula sp.]
MGFNKQDRLPMVAAIVVIAVSNVVGFAFALPVYVTILATPLALLAFGVVRYVLYGSAVPDVLAAG